jgi:hypothetical protein
MFEGMARIVSTVNLGPERRASFIHSLGDFHFAQRNWSAAADSFHRALSLLPSNTAGFIGGLADLLNSVGHLAAAQDRSVQAARMFGAESASRERSGGPRLPVVQDAYDQAKAGLIAHLGDAAFEEAFQAGALLTTPQAIHEAMAVTEELVHVPVNGAATGYDPPAFGFLSLRQRPSAV